MRGTICVALCVMLGVPVLAEPVTFTGVVVGPDDQPVAGARVVTQGMREGKWQSIEATTDAEGRFALQLDLRRDSSRTGIVATKPGLALGWMAAKLGDTARIQLSADQADLRGTLRDPAGTPVAGAEVSLETVSHIGEEAQGVWFPDRTLLTTDATGAFALKGFPPRSVVQVLITGTKMAHVRTTIRDGVAAALVLQPEATISGRVMHGDRPLPGIEVYGHILGSDVGSTVVHTGADGTYRLEHLPGGTVRVVMRNVPRGLAIPRPRTLELAPAEQKTGIDSMLTPGGLVRGTVTVAGTGAPVGGAFVGVFGDEGDMGRAPTDDNGRYELRMLPGEWLLNCFKWDYDRGVTQQCVDRAGRQITLAEGQTVEGVDFVLRPTATLRGVVVLPNGQPAKGATAAVLASHSPAQQSGPVSAEGRFEFVLSEESVSGHDEDIYVLAQLKEQGLVGLTKVQAGQDDATVKLQAGAWLTVSVVDENDKPAPEVPVLVAMQFANEPGQVLLTVTSDDKGQVRLGPLPAGVPLRAGVDWNMTHLVISPDWKRQGLYTLNVGEQRQLPLLKISPQGRSLKVVVTDTEQKPVPGAKLYVVQYGVSATTDEKGQAELTRLPLQGKVTIVAAHATLPLFAATTVGVDWDYWPGLTLKRPGEAKGQIVDEEGKPKPGAMVSCEPVQGLWSLNYDFQQRLGLANITRKPPPTDQEGRFTIGLLVDGLEYQVMLWTEWTEESRSGAVLNRFTAAGGAGGTDLGQLTYREPRE